MALVTFFLSYRWELTIPASLLLNCILKYWDRFDPQGLKKTHLVFLCDTAWSRYPLEDGERWPVGGSLKYNAAAKSLQSCLTLCDPRDGSPPGSPVPGILQARTLEWVAIAFSA